MKYILKKQCKRYWTSGAGLSPLCVDLCKVSSKEEWRVEQEKGIKQ